MTKEQQEQYDKIAATGRLSEEQLARLRAGFEKKPRKIDVKKAQLHFDKAMDCLRLEEIDPTVFVDWKPEDDEGDAYIYIVVPKGFVFGGSAKSILVSAAKAADTVSYTDYEDADKGIYDSILITLGFLGIIEDPNKPDNFTEN